MTGIALTEGILVVATEISSVMFFETGLSCHYPVFFKFAHNHSRGARQTPDFYRLEVCENE